jgi:flavin-dependent dehydrogenase
MRKVDIAILGGGLAGNLLARQLRRYVPDASVAVFERRTERSYKVGESTVEIASNYLIRRLGLSTYIYKEHLPKNGLRFFFDSENSDADLTRMSEIGIEALPPHPSFQLDRARLERDLIEMNRRDGVEMHVGARFDQLELSDDGSAHRFRTRTDGEEEHWQARWVVDASGRTATIGRQLALHEPEPNHRVAAAWGRFRNVRDMDDVDAPEWRARARHTSRVLSTNHFCYPGYWIWFIPLREGLTSVGVVIENDRWNKEGHRRDGFWQFLRQHRAMDWLLEQAELVDHKALAQLPFRTKQFFSANRWGLIGDAAAFVDPFYSPGSDFISIENDLLTDLIGRDLAGEAIEERTKLFDDFMHHRFEVTMALYEGLYPTFGSWSLFRAKAYFDTALYYNLLFDSYARDDHLNAKWVRMQLRRRGLTMETMQGFANLFRAVADEMQRRGTYYRDNLDHYDLDGRAAFGVMDNVGQARSRREINADSEAIFNATRDKLRRALDGDPGSIAALAETGAGLDVWEQIGQTQAV